MLTTLLLYVGGALFLLLFAAWLTITVYIYLQHRKYAHIPSPKMPSFYLGHLPTLRKVLGEYESLFVLLRQCTNAEGRPGKTESCAMMYLDVWRSGTFLEKRKSQEVGPVFVWFVLHRPAVYTMNPDDIKEITTKASISKAAVIYRDHIANVFGQRFLGHGLLTIPDYDTWKPRRSLYDPAFTRSYLKGLVPSFNECVDQFLERLRPLADGKTEVPMKEEFASLTLNIISKVAFGSDFTETWSDKSLGLKHTKGNGKLTFFVKHALEGIQSTFRNPTLKYLHPSRVQGYREAVRAIRTIGRECIQKRISAIENGEQVPNDILTHILEITTKEENVDIEVLIDDFATFYLAGQETTSNLLSFTLVLLIQHPDILERVLAEISEVLDKREAVTSKDLEQLHYLEQVFMESLRLYPPVGGINREAPKGLKLSGYAIPEGTIIMASTKVLSSSSEFFEDPLVFNPSRFDPDRIRPSPYVYFPFAIGHRSCIGKAFAMMEAKVIMSRLLQQFRISLPEGYEIRVVSKTTLQPKDNVLCTLVTI